MSTDPTSTYPEATGTALAALARGEVVVGVEEVCDSCDLLVLAQHATTTNLATLIRLGSGFVCVTIDSATAQRLNLPPMTWPESDAAFGGRMAVTVDAIDGTTTGISAHDRAVTVQALGDRSSRPESFTRPGHVVPVIVDARHRVGDRASAIADAARIADGSVVAFSSLVSRRDPCAIASAAEAFDFDLPVLRYADLTGGRGSRASAA